MNAGQGSLLILGASTRSAAQSARRGGWQPICGDLFADEDLRRIARVLTVDGYPHGLPAAAASAPIGPWVYVGALENHAGLIAAISSNRTLWGNPPESLADCRDPQTVACLLRESGLPALDVSGPTHPPASDGSWMLKPLRSGGGLGVRVWDSSAAASATLRRPHYFQKRQSGTAISGLFVATSAGAPLIGVARQLVGQPWLNASEFQYCGSIAPLVLETPLIGQITQIGRMLAEKCTLRGLFGCDFVCTQRTAWLTEVNPRYTSSVELFEYAGGLPLFWWHARACAQFADRSDSAALSTEIQAAVDRAARTTASPIFGKAILFAGHDVVVPDLEALVHQGDKFAADAESAAAFGVESLPILADRPAQGTSIGAGQPICTVLAGGANIADCEEILRSRIQALCQTIFRRGVDGSGG